MQNYQIWEFPIFSDYFYKGKIGSKKNLQNSRGTKCKKVLERFLDLFFQMKSYE
jgi:hypothetical protein